MFGKHIKRKVKNREGSSPESDTEDTDPDVLRLNPDQQSGYQGNSRLYREGLDRSGQPPGESFPADFEGGYLEDSSSSSDDDVN